MKLAIIVLLVAAAHAAKETGRSKQKTQYEIQKKRESDNNNNNGIEKRAPLLPTALPSVNPGVEYAEEVSKDSLQHNAPSQQIYATQPQAAKISDVLSQGQSYQDAIANQLYSTVPAYQPRFPAYEVSQPVPSHLAYAEHSTQAHNSNQQSIPKQNFVANYQPQVYQLPENSQPEQIQYGPHVFQTQQLGLVQEPQSVIASQPLYRQDPERLNYQQIRTELPVNDNQQVYNAQSQGAISYASYTQNQLVPSQKSGGQHPSEQQSQPLQLIKYQLQHQAVQRQPEYQQQLQQYQAPVQYQSPQVSQPQQVQYQTQQYQPQQQYQSQQYQPQQYQAQQQYQPQQQYQIQQQYQQQPQQYIAQPQYTQPQYEVQQQYEQPQQVQQYLVETKATPQLQVQLPAIKQKNAKQAYFKQLNQPLLQAKPSHYNQAQNIGYSGQVALPTFPPVQYFGKFAQNIFGQQH